MLWGGSAGNLKKKFSSVLSFRRLDDLVLVVKEVIREVVELELVR